MIHNILFLIVNYWVNYKKKEEEEEEEENVLREGHINSFDRLPTVICR